MSTLWNQSRQQGKRYSVIEQIKFALASGKSLLVFASDYEATIAFYQAALPHVIFKRHPAGFVVRPEDQCLS